MATAPTSIVSFVTFVTFDRLGGAVVRGGNVGKGVVLVTLVVLSLRSGDPHALDKVPPTNLCAVVQDIALTNCQ
eukprot:6253270-Amphidinium_carterae.1